MQVTDNTVNQVVSEVFSTMLGIEASPIPSSALAHEGTWIASCIHVTGSCAGSIVVQVPEPFGRRAAAAMFAAEPSALSNGEIKDALGEVANMVAGALRLALPMPNAISLPSVAEGRDLSMRVPGCEVVLETWFAAQGYEFQVTLLNRLPGK
jgi:chemotaxis protein CheX